MRISNRFAVATTVAIVAACTAVTTGTVAVHYVAERQQERAEAFLRSELMARRERVKTYFDTVAEDLQIIAATGIVQQGIVDFASAFEALAPNATETLHRLYITENPNPEGRKHALLRATDDSWFSALHARYHGWFTALAGARDYYDIFLVTEAGDVVYTTYKESDFATNLIVGRFKDTELAETFRAVRSDGRAGSIAFRDFLRYAPSGDRPAAFVGTSVVLDGQFVGALLVQLKVERFDELMRHTESMGATGETYLVGPDYLMRSRSRFGGESSVLSTRVDTTSVEAALQRTTGVHAATDYRGRSVVSAYSPLEWQGVIWAVIAEIDEDEVAAPVRRLQVRLAILGVGLTIVAFVVGWLLGERERSP